MKTLVVNLYGGPSTGKSTTCAGVFSQLKLGNCNCEMSLEWAKEKVWAEEEVTLGNQLYTFGKQFHRIWRLLGKVDIIVTDAPLLNSILYYQGENDYFRQTIAVEHQKLNNLNVLLGRERPYNPAGRLQNEEKAQELDTRIRGILEFLDQEFVEFPANRESISEITSLALEVSHRLRR